MLEVEANEILYVLYSTDTHLKNKCTQMYGTEKSGLKRKKDEKQAVFLHDDWGCQGGHMLWSMRTTKSLLRRNSIIILYSLYVSPLL